MSTAFYRRVELEEGELFHASIVDSDKHMKCVLGLDLADCIARSMENYIKLMGIGAVRVRGHRASDINPTRYSAKEMERHLIKGFPHHYWVEAKGMVYDVHGGVCQVMPKNKYYERVQIVDGSTRYAEWGMLFDDEMDTDDINIKQTVKDCKNRNHLMELARKLEDKINRVK